MTTALTTDQPPGILAERPQAVRLAVHCSVRGAAASALASTWVARHATLPFWILTMSPAVDAEVAGDRDRRRVGRQPDHPVGQVGDLAAAGSSRPAPWRR